MAWGAHLRKGDETTDRLIRTALEVDQDHEELTGVFQVAVYAGVRFAVFASRFFLAWFRRKRNLKSGQHPSRLLSVEEAASILRVDATWIYRHRDELPFVTRLSEGGPLRVSAERLNQHIEERFKHKQRSGPGDA